MARGLSDVVRDAADRIVLARGGITNTRSVEHLERENTKLRELVTNLFRATHPADRERLLINAAELGVEVDE